MLNKFILKTSVIAILTLFLTNNLFAQDPEFTQFYANPLYLNPAFAGTAHCPRVSLNYRNQWPGISGSFVTTSASYDQHVDALSGGVGLLVWNDQAGEGTLSTTNVSGIYSYQIPVTRRFSIKAGIQATWAQRKLDWSKLTFGDQIHDRRGFIFTTQEVQRDEPANYVDFSAGVLGFSEKYFVGFAVNHLTEPDESVIQGVSPLPRKFTFHAGAVLPVESKGEPASLSPNVLVQFQQNFLQINYGMYFSKGPIIGGLWYRNSDSFIALIGFQTGILKFGYSYDITVSKLTNTTAGSHEFSTGLNFDCKPKKRRFRTISCPSF
ncbi:MAG: type IX secretion system membrane protein PorP/SprF [Flavobacteriales bacterium]|nr:type IX secretion system membrane protein PorP/SprF [Flavobacteriales bacterium]